MDGIGAMFARGVQDAVDAQIALGRWRRSHPLGFIGHAHVQRSAVGVGEDGHEAISISRSVRMTRTAISPRLAIRTLRNIQGRRAPRPAEPGYR
jgi:hypothetical protein